ncbi:MAG: cupredoxin domain-containing protein [Chloroflexi bacterium]|nr:cupredoxin domain-containing protein [Chloroflexota bacterium]
MTRTFKVLIALAVVVFLGLAFVGSTGASVEPQVMRVTIKDYQVSLSQFVVTPGKAVNLVINNQGDVPHQLVVQAYADASKDLVTSPMIGSHTIQSVSFTLAPGVYRIECVQVDHAARGMVNVLTANAPQPLAIPLRVDFLIPILGLVLGSAYIIASSLGLRLTKA